MGFQTLPQGSHLGAQEQTMVMTEQRWEQHIPLGPGGPIGPLSPEKEMDTLM